MTPEEQEPTPAEMLTLVQEQQRSVAGRMGAFVPAILLAWGIALTAGFLALWLEGGGVPGVPLPIAVAGPLFAGLLLAAGVASTVLGIRSSRGVRETKESAFTGVVYGQLWWLGILVTLLIGQTLVLHGMPPALLGVYFPAAVMFFSGIMYVMSGLLWRARPMLVLGAWTIVVAGVAGFAPAPGHFLVYALAGGGACLVLSAWTGWWTRRARRVSAEPAS